MKLYQAINLVFNNTSDIKLTAAQKAALIFLLSKTNIERDGCMKCWPTNEQIKEALSTNSNKTLHGYLDYLEGVGLIRRDTIQVSDTKRQRVIYIDLSPLMQSTKVVEEKTEEDKEEAFDYVW